MIIRLITVFTIILNISCINAENNNKAPEFWSSKYLFEERSNEIWNKLSDKGQLNFDKVYNFLGNQASKDGDLEFKAALIIFCTDSDPYEYISSNLKKDDIEKKLFSLALIAHLKDKRFQSQLLLMSENPRKVKDHFWGANIGEISKYVLSRLTAIDDLKTPEFQKHAAPWLTKSWKIKIQK